MNLFKVQDAAYQETILPKDALIITIEAGSTMPWTYFTPKENTIGIDEYGYSGTKDEVLHKLHFDYESILNKITTIIGEPKSPLNETIEELIMEDNA